MELRSEASGTNFVEKKTEAEDPFWLVIAFSGYAIVIKIIFILVNSWILHTCSKLLIPSVEIEYNYFVFGFWLFYFGGGIFRTGKNPDKKIDILKEINQTNIELLGNILGGAIAFFGAYLLTLIANG